MAFKQILVSSVSAMAVGLGLAAPAAASPPACTGVISGAVTGPLSWASGDCSISGTDNSAGSAIAASGLLGTLTNTGKILGGSGPSGYGLAQPGGSIAEIYNNGGSIYGNQAIRDLGSIGTLLNTGTITGGGGYAIDNLGEIGSLGNTGLINTTEAGTALYNAAGSIGTLSNSGTIAASVIGVLSSGDIATVSNQAGGTITGGFASFSNETGAQVGSFTNSGQIGGSTVARGVLNEGSIGTLTNTGTIEGGTGFEAVGIQNTDTIGLINNTANGVITGYSGLNNSGSIGQLTNNGTLTAETGISLYNTGLIGSIDNTGVISGANSYSGIQNIHGSIGQLTNAGTISGTNLGIGNTGIIGGIIVQAGGTITSGKDGIVNGNFGNGGTILDLENYGVISGGLNGLYNYGSTIDTLYNYDTGTISNILNDIGSSIGTLTNAGKIGGIAELAIHNTNGSTIESVVNLAGGLITSTQSAIYNAATIGTVTNTGTISGNLGILNAGTMNAVDNGGTIAGGYQSGIVNFHDLNVINNTASGIISGLDGIYNNANLGTVINDGTIDGLYDFGVYNSGSLSGISNAGLITGNYIGILQLGSSIAGIINTGTISGGSTGLVNVATIGAVSNSGTITGGASAGLYNDGLMPTLSNSGVITGGGAAIANALLITALDNLGGGTIAGATGFLNITATTGQTAGSIATLSNSGSIIGTIAAGVQNGGTIFTLNNFGLISGFATGILNSATIGTLSNIGTLMSADAAFGNTIAGTINLIDNAGLIDSTDKAGIQNDGAAATIGTIINRTGATVTGQDTGIENSSGTIGAIANSGSITGLFTAGVTNDAGLGTLTNLGVITSGLWGVWNAGQLGTLDNDGGLITGATGILNNPPAQAGTITLLTNTGMISGTIGPGIDNAGSIATLQNSGLITGIGGGITNAGDIQTLSNLPGGEILALANETSGVIQHFTNAAGAALGALTNSGTIGAIAQAILNDGSIYTLTNAAAGTIAGVTTGIANNAGIGTLTNNGVISGANGVNSAGSILTFTNAGAITGVTGFGRYGVFVSTGSIGLLDNQAAGLIAGNQAIGNFSTIGTLLNEGTLYGTNDFALINASIIGSIGNSGTITAAVSAALVNAGLVGGLSNSGTIAAATGIINSGTSGGVPAGTIFALTNSGSIGGTLGAGLNNQGLIDSVTNSGTIGAAGNAVDNYGAIVDFDNAPGARIVSASTAFYNTYTIGVLANSGSIAGLAAIDSTGTIATLSNAGSITGGGGAGGFGVLNNGGIISLLDNTASGAVTGNQAIHNGAIIEGTPDIPDPSGSVILSLLNPGTILGFGDAVYNAGTIFSLGNSALIESTGGAGLDDAAGTIGTLTNSGTITAPLGAAVLNAGGSIGAVENTGIFFSRGDAVDNDAGGTIGLIDNAGLIESSENSGIVNDGALGGIGTIVNLGGGVITGQDTGIANEFGGTIARISNSGTITGTYTAGVGNYAELGILSNAGTITSETWGVWNTGNLGTLDNFAGGTISGATGILNNPPGAPFAAGRIAALSNTGLITAAAGPALDNGGSIGTLFNGGLMSAPAGYGVDSTGSIGGIGNTGTIATYGDAIYNNAGGVIGTIANAGLLSSSNQTGIENNAGTIGGATIAAILNLAGGIIAGQDSGIIDSAGGIGLIANSGLITGGYTAGVTNFDHIGTLTNAGRVSSTLWGVWNTSQFGTINNTGGTISGATGILNNAHTDEFTAGTLGAFANTGLIMGTAGPGIDNGGSILALFDDGTITGGTIGLANGGAITTLDNQPGGHVTAPGTGIANAGSIGTLTNSGIISGAGGDGIGDGTVGVIGQLTNTGTISGGVTGLDAGLQSISIANSGVIRGTSGPGLIFNAGLVTNAAGGLITGVTGVSITGDGAMLVNSGTIIGTGGTAIAVAPGADPPQIVLTGSSALAGAIDGGGTNGQITLTGQNSIFSPIVNFAPGSGLTIAAGANWTAAGSWTLDTVTNTGVLEAGTLGAPLTLTGNFTQIPGATLDVAVTPTASSQLIVSGNATIAGAVSYIFAPGTYTAKTYPYLTAGSGVTGKFTAVSYAGYVPPALSHSTSSAPVSANLNLSKGTISIITIPGIIAPEDDALFSGQSVALAQLAQSANAALLDQAARPRPPGACAAGAPPAELPFGQRDSAAQLASAAAGAFCAMGGWSQAAGGVFGVDGGGLLTGEHTSDGGFLAGIDRNFGAAGTRLGIAAGYDGATLKDGAGGAAAMDTARVDLYGAQPLGPMELAAVLGYGHAQNTTTRQSGAGALGATSATNVINFGAALSAGFSRYGFNWRPQAGIAVVRLTGLHTAETGHGLLAAFAVHGEIPGMTSVRPYLKLGISRDFVTSSHLIVQPDISVGYEMEAANRARSATIFAADGTGFSTPHNSSGAGAATVSAGIETGRGNWSLYAHYDAAIGGNWVAQMLQAGILMRF